jgi:hypothetical protein
MQKRIKYFYSIYHPESSLQASNASSSSKSS